MQGTRLTPMTDDGGVSREAGNGKHSFITRKLSKVCSPHVSKVPPGDPGESRSRPQVADQLPKSCRTISSGPSSAQIGRSGPNLGQSLDDVLTPTLGELRPKVAKVWVDAFPQLGQPRPKCRQTRPVCVELCQMLGNINMAPRATLRQLLINRSATVGNAVLAGIAGGNFRERVASQKMHEFRVARLSLPFSASPKMLPSQALIRSPRRDDAS